MRWGRSLGKTGFYVGPLLLWMALIFSLSTDAGSAARTRPAVGGIVRRLLPNADAVLSPDLIERIDWNLRKTGHVTEYAILAALAYRAFRFGNPTFRSRNLVGAFFLSVLFAASDEYHQSFHASRGAAAADVTFDTFGVTTGLLLSLWHQLHSDLSCKRGRPRKNQD